MSLQDIVVQRWAAAKDVARDNVVANLRRSGSMGTPGRGTGAGAATAAATTGAGRGWHGLNRRDRAHRALLDTVTTPSVADCKRNAARCLRVGTTPIMLGLLTPNSASDRYRWPSPPPAHRHLA